MQEVSQFFGAPHGIMFTKAVIWARCRNTDITSKGQGRGQTLNRMTFLCKEVELKEIIHLALTVDCGPEKKATSDALVS
ncbi:hypothetical protein TNIN_261321 [Trichonephila inaurata madagascariensis]|uniref:Uncharacterized protein n=1 Tax=Trichonephila inaurata madagascariensis TaxID=2747483 RepID=A0A8X6XMK3_9ARAC|nr:hypothetical protein TNIN_261321 [Trichonephila inaurata madagascariensis]